MNKIKSSLEGRKTYILGGLGIVVVGLWILGVIDTVQASQVLTTLGFGGLLTLRAGVEKAK